MSMMSSGSRRLRAQGFSLIEMMVAIVIGMIVAAGAVAMIVAIDKSNSEMIQSTRINQELTALASVIGDEIKRARRLHDPIAMAGQGGTTATALDKILTHDLDNTIAVGCILYGYQDTPLSKTTATANNALVNQYDEIYLSGGRVMFGQATVSNAAAAATNPLACSSAGADSAPVALSSTEINVSALLFTCVSPSGTPTSQTCDQVQISLTATITAGDKYEKTVSHTYVQQVFIRSGASQTT